MQQRLIAVLGNTLILVWLFAFATLLCQVKSLAGRGDLLVEEYMVKKNHSAWSRNIQVATNPISASKCSAP